MALKTKQNKIDLYKKYYIDRDYEQIDIFRLLKKEFKIEKAIYPGSYVQISPSFIFPSTVYIDSDKTANKFFRDESINPYILSRKEYEAKPDITFYAQDYTIPVPGLNGRFDLMISQYAGFISDSCKDYLRVNGYLLVNSSHGDADLAFLDNNYELIATVKKSNGKYRLSFSKLDEYFIPKKDITVSKEFLYRTRKGVGYKNTAPLYLFQRKS